MSKPRADDLGGVFYQPVFDFTVLFEEELVVDRIIQPYSCSH
jgi:hypothetical protein